MNYWASHSWRLLRHELRRGELTIIALAIILAVSAVYSLTGFSEKIKQTLLANSTEFIASDRVLRSSREIDTAYLEKAESLSLSQARIYQMSSMAFSDEGMLFSSIDAVSPGYPLRGELLVDTGNGEPQSLSAPAQGSVWVQKKVMRVLGLSLGDKVEVGVMSFAVAGEIIQIPDASFSVFNQAPVIMLHADDIAKTELIQPGSRLTYKYLFSGSSDALTEFDEYVKSNLLDTQRYDSIDDGNSPLANALSRAQQYLSLASMLGIILAAVAVAVASRRYSQRHENTVSVFKALGASIVHLRKLYLMHWTVLCFVSITLGLLVGELFLTLGIWAIKEQLEVAGEFNALYPLSVAVLTGIICAAAFAIHPFRTLMATSPMRVLRGGFETLLGYTWLTKQLLPILALFSLLLLFSQNLMLSVALLLGGGIVSGILLLIGRLLINLSRSAGTKAGKAWHLALANLQRRAQENAVQLISFTIAIKLLLIIAVLKTAIIQEWQDQLPEDSANRFVVNVSQTQLNDVDKFVSDNSIASSGLYAVVRGRLAAINEDKIRKRVSKEEDKGADNGRQGVGRELNLTWREELPNGNEVLDGQWWDPGSEGNYVSVEQELAKRLEVGLGDKLTFMLGSEEVVVEVTSIRSVDWQSMQPNFYMIFHPSVLGDFPATYISSLFVKPEQAEAFDSFIAQYPTITVIDVEAIINQLREVIAQVTVAIEFILILVVFAGSLVLVAQVQASMEERERELAILRTLGAKGRMLSLSVFYEFVALGGLAGLMASMAMELAVYLIQINVFDMTPSFHWNFWLLGIAVGSAFVGLIGLLSCRRLLNLPSIVLIRRTM